MRDSRIKERFQRDWGLELPESIFRFWAFHQTLGPVEQQALSDLGVGPYGIMDLFTDPDAQPRDGVDIRVHGRYYRDPPEFVTFMYGNTDGLHFGLWFDDGRVCSGVASYYSNDGGGIDTSAETPLEAVRAVLERVWYDLEDDDPEEAAETRPGLALLRERLTEFETGDRPEVGLAYSDRYNPPFVPPVDPDRITTLDEAGALAAGETALDRPAHNGADAYKFGTHMYALFDDPAAVEASMDDARRRCAAGDPTEALALGRDLHWASAGDPTREAYAHELLVMAYRALGRPSLAGIADAHHRHRSLPTVKVLEPRLLAGSDLQNGQTGAYVLLESTEQTAPYEKVLTMEPDLLVQQLGRVLLGIAPAGWHRLDLQVLMTGPARAMALTATMPDGGWMTAPVPAEAARIATELRLLKYRDGAGTWFSMRFMMDPPARYWVSFNTGFEPPWNPPLLAEAYREDLLTYPRTPEHTPAWLAEKVAQ